MNPASVENDLNEILGYIACIIKKPLAAERFLDDAEVAVKNGFDIAARRDYLPGGLSLSSPLTLFDPYLKCESRVDGNSRALFAAAAANTR